MKKQLLMCYLMTSSLVTYAQEIGQQPLGVSIGVYEKNLEQFFKEAKESGVDYLEAGIPSFRSTEPCKMAIQILNYKKLADNAGMKIWSVHIPFGWDFDISTPDPVKREANKQYILFSLELAKGFGKYEKAILHPSFEPIKPEERASRLIALKETLKSIGPYVEQTFGCRLAIEVLPRTCLGNSSKEMLDIIEGNPSVDVCFDVNHLLGEKTEVFGEKVGERIKTLHISDYDEKDERHWLPGKGAINWNATIKQLDRAHYKGPIMMEINKSPWEGNTKQFCEDLSKAWKKLIDVYSKQEYK